MLQTEESLLIVIDMQEKLIQVMDNKERLIGNISKLVRGIKTLGIPIIVTEQVKLGPTIPELSECLTDITPITKASFSCCGNEEFTRALNAVNRKQILLAGIESHVCVYQTAADLLSMDYEVYLVVDAVSSRTAENREICIQRMDHMGIIPVSTEMVLFELLKTAEDEHFKDISKIVK